MTGSIADVLARVGVTTDTLSAAERAELDDAGYVMLRGVFDPALCATLIEAFERRYVPSHLSQPPRGHDSRHAMLNDEPSACRACLSPRLLAGVYHLLRRRFFLHDVQGRDPVPGGGGQPMHRDWVEPGPAPTVIALAFLDPFGPANGAPRVLPGSHRCGSGLEMGKRSPYADEVVFSGTAGDVLVMNGDLAHSGTRNTSGGTRRNLQINFLAFEHHDLRIRDRDLSAYSPDERYLMGDAA